MRRQVVRPVYVGSTSIRLPKGYVDIKRDEKEFQNQLHFRMEGGGVSWFVALLSSFIFISSPFIYLLDKR